MANKPPEKGQPGAKPEKKKGGAGAFFIIWILSVVVAFFAGWFVHQKYGAGIERGVAKAAGTAGEMATKEAVLRDLGASDLEKARKDEGEKTINAAYADSKDVKKAAKGEYEYKVANSDNKVSKEEWDSILKAYAGE
jgi:hypothetical protein